ncbi:unnamed protein product [Mytilus edulis]|uniref:TNFR-Cys domain-containing protein n=1 Tax=Mytilus edulis TaxID=6550 RepID=A0A8S3RJA2_MYTED|nr:unnamed protein product [Mytilus edulis]
MKLGMVNLANCLIFIIFQKINGKPDGVCYENKLVNGKEVRQASCCDSYYKGSKGICTECPAGSFGKNCKQNCTGNFYGRQCLSECNCERCHYIFGCGGLSTTERKPTVTIELIQEISLTEMTKERNKDVTSPKYEKEKEAAFSLEHVIVIIVASSASTVVSMVIVIICVLILRRLLCEKERSESAGISNEVIFTNNDIRAQASIPQEHLRITQTSAFTESQYETVDESK